MEKSELIHLLGKFAGSSLLAQEYETMLTRKGLSEKKIIEYEAKQIYYNKEAIAWWPEACMREYWHRRKAI